MEPQAPDATDDRPEGEGPAPTPPVSTPPARPARLWTLALLAAALAGVGSWLIGELTIEYFVPPPRMVMAMGQKINVPKFEDRIVAERKNATMANGVLGALLGLSMGIAGALARGSIRAAVTGGVAGTVLGLGVGLGASEAIQPFYFRQLDQASEELSHDLILPLLVHGGIWAAVGASGGLALGLGLGSKKQIASVALGGLIGGALGAVVYEVIGATLFPASRTTEPIASYWAPRLIGKLAVCLMTAAIAIVASQSPAPKKPEPAMELAAG